MCPCSSVALLGLATASVAAEPVGPQEPPQSVVSRSAAGSGTLDRIGANSPGSPLSLAGRVGAAWFRHARSFALEHNVKPALRLDLGWALGSGWSLGGALGGVLTTDGNYGVWSLQASGRYCFELGSTELGARLGLGLSHDAGILHEDLRSRGNVLPIAELGIGALWPLTERALVGVELSTERFALFHLGASFRHDLL